MIISSGGTASTYLALNIASSIIYALVSREVISRADATEILDRIADTTLADCTTSMELAFAEPCAGWLKQVAETHRRGAI